MKTFFVLCLLGMAQLSACKKSKRLKDMVALIEARQDMESLTRRDEFASILKRLSGIELLLNKSDENRQISSLQTSMEHMKDSLNDISKQLAALVQNVPKIEKLEQVTTDLPTQVFDMCSNDSTAVKLETVLNHIETMHKQFAEQFVISMKEKINELLEPKNTYVSHEMSQNVQVEHEASCQGLRSSRVTSCSDLLSSGETDSGVYIIYPERQDSPYRVFCDMTTDGGGWTVFQRRQHGRIDFNQTWDIYKRGFGILDDEFWLGNELLSILTKYCKHELRIDLADFEGNARFATYGTFKVFQENQNYMLFVDDYIKERSTINDSLSYHANASFSTWDNDKDTNHGMFDNCADTHASGWWFKACLEVNLNGRYQNKGELRFFDAYNRMIWESWKGKWYPLKMSEMKFRKV